MDVFTEPPIGPTADERRAIRGSAYTASPAPYGGQLNGDLTFGVRWNVVVLLPPRWLG